MSAQLDKSLDEILSSNKPKKNFKSKQNKVGKKKNPPTKPLNGNNKKVPTAPAAKRANEKVVDASFATKVIVHNLPKDIKQDAIKEFFQSQVGGVRSVALSYNEKGQSKGIATIVFQKASALSKAYEKFNGAPIDNGSSKLRLELIVDPTKKPLSARITANPVTAAVVASKKSTKAAPPKKAGVAAKKQAPKPKRAKKVKKTVEDLDKEMADYFEEK